MKRLDKILEGILDDEFDIGDDDIITSLLGDWLTNARNNRFADVKQDLYRIMSDAEEISPSRRAKWAETNTVVTVHDDHGMTYFNIVHRGKHACFSHISYTWMGNSNKRATVQKGKHNLIEFKNKRKVPGLTCWALPSNSFDRLYETVG